MPQRGLATILDARRTWCRLAGVGWPVRARFPGRATSGDPICGRSARRDSSTATATTFRADRSRGLMAVMATPNGRGEEPSSLPACDRPRSFPVPLIMLAAAAQLSDCPGAADGLASGYRGRSRARGSSNDNKAWPARWGAPAARPRPGSRSSTGIGPLPTSSSAPSKPRCAAPSKWRRPGGRSRIDRPGGRSYPALR